MEQAVGIAKFTKYGAVTRNMESDPYFRSLEESLVKTLEYLDSRYLITNTYNYFENPSNQHKAYLDDLINSMEQRREAVKKREYIEEFSI